MDKLVVIELIRQLSMSSIFIILVFLFIKILYSVQSEKRLSSFAMETKANEELSLIDSLKRIVEKIVNSLCKILKKSNFFKKYASSLEKYLLYTNSKLKGMHLIAVKFLITILMQIVYLIANIFSSNAFNIYTFLVVSTLSFMFLDLIVIYVYNKQKKLIEEQLLQAIVIMNSAFKSGKNITEAIIIVKKELPSPIKEEFEIISKDLSYGLSLNDAFSRFYDRIKLEEAKYITASLSLLSKTGGNIVTVFNMIEKNFYNRLKIKNELGALTSSSKFLYRLLAIMPFIFIIITVMLNPDYFNPLLSEKLGILIIMIMVLLYSLYLVIIKRIMKVDEV